MSLFSKGGKYSAAPKTSEKKGTIPAAAPVPAVDVKPAAKPAPASETKPVTNPAPAPATKPAVKPVPDEVITEETKVIPVVKAAPAAKPAAKASVESLNPEARKAYFEERAASRKAETKARKSRNIWITALVIFCVIILGTLGFLFARKMRSENEYRQLAEQIQQIEEAEATAPPTTEYVEPTQPAESTPEETEPVETEPPVKTILPKYAEFYQENTEFFGWIRLDGTALDYPVMRSFDDNNEYLYADFYGEYNYSGIPFADIKCSHDSDNILIYGHNMIDGSMFRSLLKYERESYWKEHPTIMFSDLYEDYEYEVVAVFRDRVYRKSDTCFKFYQFIDAEDEADFDYAISQFKEKSIYDTGVEVEYGDKLITLITCAYHVDNGRFVVVARRK